MRVYFIEISLRKKHDIVLICLVFPFRSTCTEQSTIVTTVMETVTDQRMPGGRSRRLFGASGEGGGNTRGSAAWLRRTCLTEMPPIGSDCHVLPPHPILSRSMIPLIPFARSTPNLSHFRGVSLCRVLAAFFPFTTYFGYLDLGHFTLT